MAVNIGKTKYCTLFHLKNRPLQSEILGINFNDSEINNPQDPVNIHKLGQIGIHPVEISTSYKLLGTLLDENLFTNCHFINLRNKLSQAPCILKIFSPKKP